MVNEFAGGVEILLYAHAGWTLVLFAGRVEDVPGGFEMVVEVGHVLCHAVVDSSF